MNILGMLTGGGTKDLIEGVGGVIDNLHTSKEEKLEAAQKIKELVANYEVQMEKEISTRWDADMKSDSWLSKNVRPLVLIFLVISTVLLIFIDAGAISFVVQDKWTDLLQLVLICKDLQLPPQLLPQFLQAIYCFFLSYILFKKVDLLLLHQII